jgi:ribosome-associated protein
MRIADVDLDDSELAFEFIRSAGPGGQNVNKVATAVRLSFDLARTRSLPPEVRDRLRRIAGRRVGADGWLSILARRFRTQEANRQDAVARLATLIERAREEPKPRKPTAPGRAARERRLENKRRRSTTKARRGPVRPGQPE